MFSLSICVLFICLLNVGFWAFSLACSRDDTLPQFVSLIEIEGVKWTWSWVNETLVGSRHSARVQQPKWRVSTCWHCEMQKPRGQRKQTQIKLCSSNWTEVLHIGSSLSSLSCCSLSWRQPEGSPALLLPTGHEVVVNDLLIEEQPWPKRS